LQTTRLLLEVCHAHIANYKLTRSSKSAFPAVYIIIVGWFKGN